MNGNKETYTAAEKNSFKVFRGNFIEAGTTEAWEQVIREHMLPVLIKFWHDTNNPQAVGIEGPMAAEDQTNIVKELKNWAVNNWHWDNNWNNGSHELNVNTSAFVDWLYSDRVNEVLCDLISIKEKVQDELSTIEFVHVQVEKAQLGSVCNPPDIQCKLAKTQAVARIKAADTKRLKEMGMVSLTLVGWVKENGKMGVEL
ncbi:hypothetical protein DXG01_005575, partial [Tephrocybe rancida]